MATILSGTNYTTLSDYFADLRAQLDGAVHYLYDAVQLIVQLDDTEPTIDLLQEFYNVYIAQTSALQSNAPFLSVVRALNNHVIRRGGYSSLNSFLGDNTKTGGTTSLDENWANMCEDAGYDIHSNYVL
jgi:hypothetical protein